MQERYRKHMTWWFEEFAAADQVDHYVELFPKLDSRLVKFAIGIYLWNMQRFIDIDKPDDVDRVRSILDALEQTPNYEIFNGEFNELDPDTVCEIIGAAGHYISIFPELDSKLVKFTSGIFMWNKRGLINIDNPDDVSKVRALLKALDQSPWYEEFDNVFYEEEPDTVCETVDIDASNL